MSDEPKRPPAAGWRDPGSAIAQVGAVISPGIENELPKMSPEIRDRVRAVVDRKRDEPR